MWGGAVGQGEGFHGVMDEMSPLDSEFRGVESSHSILSAVEEIDHGY
jgi:hypothetical protein